MAYKKQATFKEYTIGVRENNSIEVLVNGKPYDGAVKHLLQDIAQNVGFSVEKKWNTQDLGRKLVDIINNKETKIGKPTSNITNKEKTPAILINIMYSGSYLKENLGHEVINLIATDNDEHYIYVNPIGKIGKDAIKKYNIEYILLGQLTNAKTVKVIAKATGLKMLESTKEALTGEGHNANEGKILQIIYDRHKKELKLKDVKYGGKKLEDIFPDERQLLATFKADKVVMAKKETYIYAYDYKEDEENKLPESYHDREKSFEFAKQKPYMYFPKTNKKGGELPDYEKLLYIIEHTEWEENSVEEYNPDKVIPTSMLEIMGKEFSELSYSNMIHYFLANYTKLQGPFIEFLTITKKNPSIPPTSSFEIYREYHPESNNKSQDGFENESDNKKSSSPIDLLIKYGENRIIIENKIKAEIGALKTDGEGNQLTRYVEELKKYENVDEEKIHCFILTPKYHKIDIEQLSEQMEGANKKLLKKYKSITYEDLHNFFEKNKRFISTDRYLEEFLSALKLHASDTDDYNYRIMMRRLGKRIKDIDELKK
ncbi:MAG: PD-(D/E)XK nuclease family protein [Bacteroidales bacterium]|nr:PD-(D/E)XK nuclease family protein [Bacteroidales bacterium]